MYNYMLIFTDGYNIETEKFYSRAAVETELKNQYETRMLDECGQLDGFDEDDIRHNSYICDSEAMIYTGENVYVLKIVSL